jgi:RNA polymerase sigma-70 factor (ECF subfamily)
MREPDDGDRISNITTAWTLLRRAHGGGDDARAALELLVVRYRGAVHRYLCKCVGETDAEDLTQQFVVALLEGKFHGADPAKGRFRNYLRRVLSNMTARHRHRSLGRSLNVAGATEPAAPASDDLAFDAVWREQLIERTWVALKEVRLAWFEVLRLKIERPGLRSPELAVALGERLGRQQTAEAARQALHRAREKFADLLLEEVAHSLERPSAEALEEELAALELLEQCRTALERRSR